MIGGIGIFKGVILTLGEMKTKLIHIYKNVVGLAEFVFSPPNDRRELVVFAMHSTPKYYNSQFNLLVESLLKIYKPIKPSEALQYLESDALYQDGPYCLFTFDDGLKNNLHAAEILKSKDISALFFIVPDFITSTNQNQFYRTNIRPQAINHLEKNKEDISALSIEDLILLGSWGHAIGAHTKDHLLRSLNSEMEVNARVVDCKETIQEWIGKEVEHFASPIDTLYSVNSYAAKIIREHYRLHHLTIPGRNAAIDKNLKSLYRRNFEVDWTSGAVRFALGDFDLRRWKTKQDAFSLLLQQRQL